MLSKVRLNEASRTKTASPLLVPTNRLRTVRFWQLRHRTAKVENFTETLSTVDGAKAAPRNVMPPQSPWSGAPRDELNKIGADVLPTAMSWPMIVMLLPGSVKI